MSIVIKDGPEYVVLEKSIGGHDKDDYDDWELDENGDEIYPVVTAADYHSFSHMSVVYRIHKQTGAIEVLSVTAHGTTLT